MYSISCNLKLKTVKTIKLNVFIKNSFAFIVPIFYVTIRICRLQCHSKTPVKTLSSNQSIFKTLNN